MVEYTAAGLFLAGLALGVSQCTLTCGPIVGLYIGGTTTGWRDGLKATLAFSLSRLCSYLLLGFVAGLSHVFITTIVGGHHFSLYLRIAMGLLISILGLLVVLGKEPRLKLCRLLKRDAIPDSTRSMALLGFMIGVTPCAPLLGVLGYIALSAKGALQGLFCSFCFGVGPAFLTPLVIVGIVAGVLPSAIFKTPRLYQLFQWVCGALLIFYGIRLVTQVL